MTGFFRGLVLVGCLAGGLGWGVSVEARAAGHDSGQGSGGVGTVWVPPLRGVLGELGWYADPEIHVFGGQYWIYPTYSEDVMRGERASKLSAEQVARRAGPGVQRPYLTQTFLDAFSSDDLVHWTRHDAVLDVKDVRWAAYAVWAPTAMEVKGKYYLLFGANDIQKDQTTLLGGIGLAESDQPGGPFKDALGKPLIGEFHHGAQPIDPFVFKDDDGKVYLYYGGQGHCNVAELSGDLKRVVPMADGELFKEITPKHYVEGPFVVKRKGVYYFMWSEGGWGGPDYSVAYAKSASPMGPFERVGKILETAPGIETGAGHHSVLQIPGTDEWYIVYHRHPLGDTEPNHRVLAVDRMYFDADGNIVPVKVTKEGPAARVLTTAEKRAGK